MDTTQQQERLAEWMRDHGAIVHGVVNGFASGDDRKDLLQEVIIAVWKAIPAFRGQAKATTYLYRVSHNAALLWTRTQKNYRRRLEIFGELSPQERCTISDASTAERLEALYSAIRRLKPPDRSLILMSLDELSYREIADVLGISENNVGVKISRIKDQLYQILEGNTDEQK